MEFTQLIKNVAQTQHLLQNRAMQTVNQLLVTRNWLVGYHIVVYEQNGADKAKYGSRIIKTMAEELRTLKLKGFSQTNLKLFRQFYLLYPHLQQVIFERLNASSSMGFVLPIEEGKEKRQPLADQLQLSEKQKVRKGQPLADQFLSKPEALLNHFSFRHFTELLKIEEPLKRYFYEQQVIRGNWSARQLSRQIETLYYERVGLSKNKDEMLGQAPAENYQDLVRQSLNDPYIFEFTGFRELPEYSENDLETALLNKIEDFLLELGHGFCFEARQKRITIDGEHDRVDLVFYHRVLKCHVIIDLKIGNFRKEYVGQMNYYLNYYRDKQMTDGDNPPVGMILCTGKNETQVKYATAGLDQQIFVSKYKVELPEEQELVRLLESSAAQIRE